MAQRTKKESLTTRIPWATPIKGILTNNISNKIRHMIQYYKSTIAGQTTLGKKVCTPISWPRGVDELNNPIFATKFLHDFDSRMATTGQIRLVIEGAQGTGTTPGGCPATGTFCREEAVLPTIPQGNIGLGRITRRCNSQDFVDGMLGKDANKLLNVPIPLDIREFFDLHTTDYVGVPSISEVTEDYVVRNPPIFPETYFTTISQLPSDLISEVRKDTNNISPKA
ncbi:uncharacterized protein G2W53_021442 [Senna tora]|uniref:Uncharacterized protein n=1 Tax=Senna tora TaxID=362788 RepID=A0A834TJK8_9FABA|nr:uncharacterized protein G2W53_021442 [Senna tora]